MGDDEKQKEVEGELPEVLLQLGGSRVGLRPDQPSALNPSFFDIEFVANTFFSTPGVSDAGSYSKYPSHIHIYRHSSGVSPPCTPSSQRIHAYLSQLVGLSWVISAGHDPSKYTSSVMHYKSMLQSCGSNWFV